MVLYLLFFLFFFFNDTATTEIYTLSLHDALPISVLVGRTSRAREFVFMHSVPILRDELLLFGEAFADLNGFLDLLLEPRVRLAGGGWWAKLPAGFEVERFHKAPVRREKLLAVARLIAPRLPSFDMVE